MELSAASIPAVLSTLATPSQKTRSMCAQRQPKTTVHQLLLECTGSEPKTTEIGTLAVSQDRAQVLPCHNWCSGGLLARTKTLGSWDWTLASSTNGKQVVGVLVNTRQTPSDQTTPTNWETELEQHRQHSARGRTPASAQDGQPVVWITSMVSTLPNPLRTLSTLE